VSDLIALISAFDGVLQSQARADADYFLKSCDRLSPEQSAQVRAVLLDAYRWQYIVSGVQEPRFSRILAGMIGQSESARIGAALAALMGPPSSSAI
jgi:hypothetical protein